MDIQGSYCTEAFILLFDRHLGGSSFRVPAEVMAFIDSLRKTISLSRKEAQYLLALPAVQPERIIAGFVLVYEGVSVYRMEADFSFEAEDLDSLTELRLALQKTRARNALQKLRNAARSL